MLQSQLKAKKANVKLQLNDSCNSKGKRWCKIYKLNKKFRLDRRAPSLKRLNKKSQNSVIKLMPLHANETFLCSNWLLSVECSWCTYPQSPYQQ
eukprot:1970432-Amphidinium_carterae.1